MKKKTIIGNWKMYVTKPEDAKKFASSLRRKTREFPSTEVSIAPSYVLLPTVIAAFKNSSIKVGAQSASQYKDQKRTGEVSAEMLKATGATFALVGHSERRAMGETHEQIRAELERVLEVGMTAVLCVGEEERDPSGAYLSVIVAQLTSALEGLTYKPGKLIIAYEPVWAIGKTATDAMTGQDLREMTIFIKKTLAEHVDRAHALKVPILYGGAVEAENAASLLKAGDVSGFLVGHASTDIDSFVGILKTLAKK